MTWKFLLHKLTTTNVTYLFLICYFMSFCLLCSSKYLNLVLVCHLLNTTAFCLIAFYLLLLLLLLYCSLFLRVQLSNKPWPVSLLAKQSCLPVPNTKPKQPEENASGFIQNLSNRHNMYLICSVPLIKNSF